MQIKDRVPADCLIINTFNENGDVFIKTDQLDGETDWKQRVSVKPIFDILKSEEGRAWFYNPDNIKEFQVDCEPPSKNIYKFGGKLH